MKYFNGNRLKKARQYRGLTVNDLAEKIDVSKQAISLYENNKSIPEFDKVRAMANELSFPNDYFIRKDLLDVKTESTYFRSLLKTSKKYRVEQIIKMEHLVSVYSILKEYIKFPGLNLPELPEKLSPSEAARELRSFWELSGEPIQSMIRVLEENGIIVTMFHTSTDDIDAFSQYVENEGTVMYLVALSKNKDTAVRTNFDAAHELGHIMLHPWSEDIESLSREEFKEREKEANEFAAAFLLPEKPFIRDVSAYPNNLNYYIELKKKWKVSIQAMLYRSQSLGQITQNQYQYLMKVMQKKNWRKVEPLDDIISTVKPSLFYDAINILLSENVFTASEFMKMLSERGLPMLAAEVETLLDLPKDTLTQSDDEMGLIVTLKDNLKQ